MGRPSHMPGWCVKRIRQLFSGGGGATRPTIFLFSFFFFLEFLFSFPFFYFCRKILVSFSKSWFFFFHRHRLVAKTPARAHAGVRACAHAYAYKQSRFCRADSTYCTEQISKWNIIRRAESNHIGRTYWQTDDSPNTLLSVQIMHLIAVYVSDFHFLTVRINFH